MIGKNQNISGAITAGGKSSRMGEDKGLINYNGKPLVSYGIELLSLFTDNIFISTNNSVYSQFRKPLINDIYKNCGPLGGIHAILITIDTNFALVISCDMPLLTSLVLKKLVENISNYDIIIPRIDGHIEPLCAIYSKTLLSEIETRIANNNYKLQDLIFSSKTKFVDFNDSKNFLNINTKSDLNKLEKR